MRERAALVSLIAFPVAYVALAVAAGARLVAARPERAWLLALLPLAALLAGGRRRATLWTALAELAALWPLHAFLTLLRAARLEGG